MHTRFIDSIHAIDAAQWDGLLPCDYPFLRHGFLAALEDSHSTHQETGWQPHHLLAFEEDRLIALMPLFIKSHSYGEYVFDWAWADAYHRNGIEYYPKLLAAVPFTPATGPRWAIAQDRSEILSALLQAVHHEAERLGSSSLHVLFPESSAAKQLADQGMLLRTGCQYHWYNEGFADFEAFLATFSSRKRKNVKKERRAVAEQGIDMVVREGEAIREQDWRHFFLFYHLTYFKRSGRQGYLTEAFFPLLAKALGDQVVMVCAEKDGDTVAAALYFRDQKTLYGRYWGCKEEFDMLHFDACYYQGIEYAIANGLERFDPGAQGEHKIQRGFTPSQTCSYHTLYDPRFAEAIERYLVLERRDIEQHIELAKDKLPFKCSEES